MSVEDRDVVSHDLDEASMLEASVVSHLPLNDPALSFSLFSRPSLKPRQPWMLEDDSRSDADAENDWHRASDRLFGTTAASGPDPFSGRLGDLPLHAVAPGPQVAVTTLSPGSVTTPNLRDLSQAVSASSVPYVPVDLSHAYMPTSAPPTSVTSLITRWTSFPRSKVPHLNTKILRQILAARETIFKYGIYLPRNDRNADASSESLRWHSGRQLEWLRLKKVEAFEYDWTKE